MNNRFFLLIGIFWSLCSAVSVFAEKPERTVDGLVNELAKQYSKTVAEAYSKQACAVLEVKNEGKSAREHFVGEAVRSYVKSALAQSLVFYRVDRDDLAAVFKELELSASGVVGENSAARLGEIEGVRFFISGSVAESGEAFIITLSLIEAQTAKVVATAQKEIPRAEMIKVGDAMAYDAMAPNGIGLTLQFSPPFMMMPSAEPAKSIHGGSTSDFGGTGRLTYRLTRHFKFGLGFRGMQNMVYTTELPLTSMLDFSKLSSVTNYPLWGTDGSLGTNRITLSLLDVTRSEQRITGKYAGLVLTGSYVWPLRRNLNVSFGGGLNVGSSSYNLYVSQVPTIVGSGVDLKTYEFTVYQRLALGLTGEAELEWFLLPRFAVNLGAEYDLIRSFGTSNDKAVTATGGRYYDYRSTSGGTDVVKEAFGLNPFKRSDGEFIESSFDYFCVHIGITLYI